MSLLQGMSERLPFDTVQEDEQGDDEAITKAFPSSYPRKDIKLASRMILVADVAHSIFGQGLVIIISLPFF